MSFSSQVIFFSFYFWKCFAVTSVTVGGFLFFVTSNIFSFEQQNDIRATNNKWQNNK